MKLLVTGGAGYIGSVLVPLLLNQGHAVRVVDSLMYGGESLLPLFAHPGFEFVKGDIRDGRLMREAATGREAVIHLAAVVGYPACRRNPELAQAVNVEGSRSVQRAADGRPVLFASTVSNYGSILDAVCTEETPLNPLSLYGTSKTEAERLLLEGGGAVAFRLATAFGVSARMRLDLLINAFAYQALTQQFLVVYERHVMRTFIHVRDAARAFLFALENLPAMLGQVFNVGSEAMNYSKEQICDMIGQRTRCYVHYADVGADPDQRNYVVGFRKIYDLGYRTTMSVEGGIDELLRALAVLEIRERYSNV